VTGFPVDDVSERVMKVVADETGWNILALAPDSDIENDLGCTGDRARELMLRMEREFGIDMTQVDFSRHFGNDSSRGWPVAVAFVVALPTSVLAMHLIGVFARSFGWHGSAWLASSWFFATVYLVSSLVIAVASRLFVDRLGRGSGRTPVTVGDLIDAARTGQWPLSSSNGQAT
jgi:Protein of unknown function (DUF1493)